MTVQLILKTFTVFETDSMASFPLYVFSVGDVNDESEFGLLTLKCVNKEPTNWWRRQNAAPLKFDSKQSEAAFSTVFSRQLPTGSNWSRYIR